MAQNVTIAGAQYSDVPAIDLPKTGGGTARFYDPQGNKALTPTLAAQTDVDVKTFATASVAAITKELLASLDADFVAENIKKGVDLFGLVGTLEGGGGGERRIVTGAYEIASDKVIGTRLNNAIKIATGLSRVDAFAFVASFASAASLEYNMLCGVFMRNGDDYFSRRYHQSGTSYTSIYPGNSSTMGTMFYDDNGTMVISGITSSTKVTAGVQYMWFAIGI